MAMLHNRAARADPPVLVIYHGNCDDGMGAALAVKLADDMKSMHPAFVAGKYHEPIAPELASGAYVIFVDFAYKRHVMKEICARAHGVMVLDHHKSAMEDLAGLDREMPNLVLRFDMSRSGAVLAWEHFHPAKPVPLFYQYLQARDLWQLDSMPFVRDFSNALRSYPQTMDWWVNYLDDEAVKDMIREGKSISRFVDAKIVQMHDHRFAATVGGAATVLVNCPYWGASDMADYILRRQPTLSFAGAFFHLNAHTIQFSLRSRGEFDVARLAEGFGGGGHKQAAGFTYTLSPQCDLLRIDFPEPDL